MKALDPELHLRCPQDDGRLFGVQILSTRLRPRLRMTDDGAQDLYAWPIGLVSIFEKSSPKGRVSP
jgi:hypothetical protein